MSETTRTAGLAEVLASAAIGGTIGTALFVAIDSALGLGGPAGIAAYIVLVSVSVVSVMLFVDAIRRRLGGNGG